MRYKYCRVPASLQLFERKKMLWFSVPDDVFGISKTKFPLKQLFLTNFFIYGFMPRNRREKGTAEQANRRESSR